MRVSYERAVKDPTKSEFIALFAKFLKDPEKGEMYVTGVAGTGKTTKLDELVSYCIDEAISNVVCAYTHKACGVLRVKLHKKAKIATTHSFLTKRPTINDKALVVAHVDGNAQAGAPEVVKVMFIDEFSMVGEKDFVDISAIQYNEDGDLKMKVVYIGDPNQLPPVKDTKAVEPRGPYWVHLTKIYRQANDNPLIDTLLALNDYINGEDASPLREHSHFIRGQNIVELFKQDKGSKILLAYTNEQVQALNAEIEGKEDAQVGDEVFSPTTRVLYTVSAIEKESAGIVGLRGDLLPLGSKYRTLETIHELDGIRFFTLEDEHGNEAPRACIFGHSSFLKYSQKLAARAVEANAAIERKFKQDAKEWSRANSGHELANKRGKAWSQYLAFKDYVMCVDFKHAMTVHKSQGSTYDNVYLDMEDMSRCAKNDYNMYLKLLYVAISRAAQKVYTN